MPYGTRRFLTFAILIFFALTAHAAVRFPSPTVEFSGDNRVSAAGMVMESKVYHAKDKDRMEMNMGGADAIIIVRQDKKLSYRLNSAQKTYSVTPMDQGQSQTGDLENCTMDETRQGSDSVGGHEAAKSLVKMSCPDGRSFEGMLWLSPDNIPLKMSLKTKTPDGQEMTIDTEMRNLRVGPQDAALFEIPSGYTDAGAMVDDIEALRKMLEGQKK